MGTFMIVTSLVIGLIYMLVANASIGLFLLVSLIAFLVINLLLWIFALLFGFIFEHHQNNSFAFWYVKCACKYVMFWFGLRLKVKGNRELPKDRGFVLVGNHQSALDIIIMYAMNAKYKIGCIGKIELWKIPFLNRWLNATGCVAIDRDNPRKSVEAVINGSKKVAEGKPMLIFPEGTRTKYADGHFNEFKAGSFKMAVKAHADIYPFCIHNLYNRKRRPLIPQNIYITYLEPLTYEEYKDLNTTEIAEIVKNRINDEFVKGYK